jgi:hypothetical protein
MGGILQVDSVLNNNTSNLITQTNSTTITIGSTGQTISLASGASSSGFGLSWNPTVQTTNFTASVGVGYMVNTTSAVVTVTLPASPTVGDQVAFVDFQETAATNNIILDPNGLKIDGTIDSTRIINSGEGVTILYSGTTRGWIPVSAVNEGTTALSSDYSVDFLVIAGGASGARGGGGSGGGGAGGYRNSYASETSGGGGSTESNINLIPGQIYTITVGAGGASVTSSPTDGNSGSNSSIVGSGVSIISLGGGGGGQASGVSGGCGGGAGENSPYLGGGASGTTNQGFGSGYYAGSGLASGGGGVGVASANGDVNGNGGNGLSSSITGSAVTRGGGGGCSRNASGGNSGGTGGGGNGGAGSGGSGTVSAGTTNTGGGGGGNWSVSGNSGAGGSGIVILRFATVHYTGTTSGSPTVTTSGSDTILTFTGSGTYTA